MLLPGIDFLSLSLNTAGVAATSNEQAKLLVRNLRWLERLVKHLYGDVSGAFFSCVVCFVLGGVLAEVVPGA